MACYDFRGQHLLTAEIITGHEAYRPGQVLDPFGQIIHLFLVVERESPGRMIDEAFVSCRTDRVLEMFATPVGPIETAVARVSEVFETAFQQVVRRQMGDGAVVGFKPR